MNCNNYAWDAGILDGEGSISLLKLSRHTASGFPNYTLKVSIGVRRDRDLSMFTRYGGHIADHPGKGRTQPWHSWVVTGTECLVFLKAVYPFLRWKRRLAELAIAFQEYMEERIGSGYRAMPVSEEEDRFRKEIYVEMRALNNVRLVPVKS